MKLVIIISQKNPETVWNAFRLANMGVKQDDEVVIFLVGEGVEYDVGSSEKFNIKGLCEEFLTFEKAKIMACTTCIKLRNQEGTATCPMNSLKDLYALIREYDKVLTF